MNIEAEELDPIHIRGSNLIDSIEEIEGMLEYIKGYKLLDVNEVITLDYRVYLVDINFEGYFRK